ncbi:hypothetical protein SISNIDRAFT_508679 [Sistotremastrum niveocremeum HHB9708]|uniref:Uncharacterized protein n=1 Tax=Sistotremastrum niveocremeum HHB9708 TaxID=1314777 RepID=A0A164U9K4_9AGAM|nr:hypothetical protein SISNIDRAFT_508679 [Sistotremastrum niveocremeum HHB9708]
MALSNVVSQLVRASMGASVPTNVTDEELDRHIAELIVQEAKKKATQYSTEGVRAYLPTESNAPKTNKRFLSSVIKSTDDHNKSVLRAQALLAAEAKAAREEEERRERAARAREATDSRTKRLLGSSLRRDSDDERWDVRRERDRRGGKRKERDWDDDDKGRSRSDRTRSRSPSRRSHKSRTSNEGHSSSRKHRSRRSSSRDRRHSRTSPPPSPKPTRSTRPNSPSPPPKPKFRPITVPRSPSPIASGSTLPLKITTPSPSPSPDPDPMPSSKMDKYFSEQYDPRLDTAPLSLKPDVPDKGLIPAEGFEGWDAMLDLIKKRREDKAERKRLEKLYGISDNDSKKKKKKKDKGLVLAWEDVEKRRQKLDEQEVGIMDLRYKSRGSVREWDMGKEGTDLT